VLKKNLLAIGALACLSLPVFAGEWAGDVGLGYIATQGNSQTRSLSSKLGAAYTADPWKNTFTAASISAADQNGTTAERYTVNDKVDYSFNPANYAFLLGEYEKDLFGGIRERMSEIVGYGRHILPGPVHMLDAEIGAGARQTQENVTGLRHNEPVGRLNGRYLWAIAEHTSFGEAVKVEAGETNTLSESVTELKVVLIGNLAAVGSYTVRHNSHAPPGTGATDIVTAANLTYTFGEQHP
jgi:putative salt-induced outer membrane protein